MREFSAFHHFLVALKALVDNQIAKLQTLLAISRYMVSSNIENRMKLKKDFRNIHFAQQIKLLKFLFVTDIRGATCNEPVTFNETA